MGYGTEGVFLTVAKIFSLRSEAGTFTHTVQCIRHAWKNSRKLLPRLLLLLQLPIPPSPQKKKKNTRPVDGNEKSSHIGFWNKLEGMKTPHVKWEVMAETSPQSERFRGFYMPPLLLLLLPLANPPSTGAYREHNISFRVLFRNLPTVLEPEPEPSRRYQIHIIRSPFPPSPPLGLPWLSCPAAGPKNWGQRRKTSPVQLILTAGTSSSSKVLPPT